MIKFGERKWDGICPNCDSTNLTKEFGYVYKCQDCGKLIDRWDYCD